MRPESRRTLQIGMVAPAPGLPGGQSVQAASLAEALRNDGHDVRPIAIEPVPPAGLRWVRRLPLARTVLNQALYLPSLRRLSGVDVAHVFSASHGSFFLAAAPAIIVARRTGARVVLHYHCGDADAHLRRWGGLTRTLLRRVDAIVVPSRYLAGIFARHGYATTVVPNVVDLARFRYRERAPLAPRLLAARSLDAGYGVDAILEAFACLRRRHPGATLTIAGSGREEGRLKARAADLGAGGVAFLGSVPPREMPRIYAACDIFVNASILDNQPVSVLEACGSGLPVVSTTAGDLGAMVRHGETGLNVPPRDPLALAGAVSELLDDPDGARAMARRARAEVESHAWPGLRQRWLDVYAGAAR